MYLYLYLFDIRQLAWHQSTKLKSKTSRLGLTNASCIGLCTEGSDDNFPFFSSFFYFKNEASDEYA